MVFMFLNELIINNIRELNERTLKTKVFSLILGTKLST